ncbi:cytochrome P450 71D10-like [Chenopodium quinoa]|uniref:Cytochrome P450 n=1 Tax=Chenopodium quinoa TaxID=63459 RepID=A0A803M8U3_CHEQI|nr:cytochrome P450 71D10-like [Chenopodium quinoa]
MYPMNIYNLAMETLLQYPLFIIFISTLFFTYVIKSMQKPTSKLPPCPPKLPFIGNLHLLSSKNTLPHRRLAELSKKYGRVMMLQLGQVPTIIVTSADMAREVMKTHDAVFCNRPELMVGKEVFYDCKDIGLAPYGEYWRQVRKISTLELFTVKRVESFRFIREEETLNMLKAIRKEVGGCAVNLSNKFFVLACDVMCRATFGTKGNEQAALRAYTAGVTETCTGFCPADVYPSINFLKTISRGKFQKFTKESDRILDPIISDHQFKKKQGKHEEDLVDVLLKYHTDNVDDPDDFSMSTDNIKGVIVELLGGGSENSSATLEWTMSELLKNPRAMEKAQAEVRRVYEEIGVVDETKLHELKYLKHVVREALRLHPPVPLLVPRESMERCQIYSYDIPAKTRVVINAWAIGRDPEYWTDPEKFSPERFEDCLVDYKGNNFELIPFGAGRRRCPGMTLGVANVELALAALLYHFDWKLPNGAQPEDLEMDESYGLTMRRKNNLFAIPIPFH